VSRPRGFAELAGRSVGIWGVGVEGTAAARRLSGVAASLTLVDDVADPAHGVTGTREGGLERLAECDVVLKSPGIPRRRADVLALEAAGVTVTSALNLWLAEADRAHVIGVTGTKGKSTTTALITFVLGALGENAHSAGNIGRPPYDVDFPVGGWVVLEVSSFQAVDLEVAPAIVVVTSLGADHLDWHGSLAQYHEDKLALTRAAGDHLSLLAEDPALAERRDLVGGVVRVVEAREDDLVDRLGLLGRHNAGNVALALAAAAAATGRDEAEVADVVRAVAGRFEPLAGRLTLVRERGGVRYVDDGLATAPLPTVAALEVFADVPVALIVGGFDRGVDYAELAEAVARRERPTALVAMPDAGERIARRVRESAEVPVAHCEEMDDAVAAARSALPDGGVVLLSPAAPSFGRYANWRERSDAFTRAVAALD
jgi:UDP-N-acetylmuramoylalanine--D-glutamate ligase